MDLKDKKNLVKEYLDSLKFSVKIKEVLKENENIAIEYHPENEDSNKIPAREELVNQIDSLLCDNILFLGWLE